MPSIGFRVGDRSRSIATFDHEGGAPSRADATGRRHHREAERTIHRVVRLIQAGDEPAPQAIRTVGPGLGMPLVLFEAAVRTPAGGAACLLPRDRTWATDIKGSQDGSQRRRPSLPG